MSGARQKPPPDPGRGYPPVRGERQAKGAARRDGRKAPATPPAPDVARALAEVTEARAALGTHLDQLSSAARSAVDIPAKVRQAPVKTAALAGSAGFLLLGGPRRVLRAAGSRLFPRRRGSSDGLLPEEIERILRNTGTAAEPGVREALAQDFAEYLQRKGKVAPVPNGRASLWRTYDVLVGPLGRAASRALIERLLAAKADLQDSGRQE